MNQRSTNFLIGINFLPMLIVPTILTIERSIILIITLLLGLAYFLFSKKKVHIPITYIIIFLIFQLIFFISIFIGILNLNPGAFSFLNVFNIYPFFFFIASILLLKNIMIIEQYLLISLFINGLIAIFITVTGFYFSDVWVLLNENEYLGGNFGAGRNEIGMPEYVLLGYVSILYCTIFYASSRLFRYFFNKKISMSTFLKVILSIIILILSGQRSFLLALLFSFLIIMLTAGIYLYKNRRYFKFSKIYYFVLTFLVTCPFIFIQIYKFIINDVDFFSNAVSIRTSQISMFNNIADLNRFFGSGFGYVGDIIRSEEMPWAYEVSYHLMLGSMGVWLFSLFLIISVIIFIVAFNSITSKKSYFVNFFPHLLGLISVLIVSIFNPFLFKFDVLWVFFVPIISWISLSENKYES